MEQRIIDTANKYKKMAEELKDIGFSESVGKGLSEQAQYALLKLYYSDVYETGLQKCEEFLDEDTDEETAAAVENASEAVSKAVDLAFSEAEMYAERDEEFANIAEGISEGSETGDLLERLIKLYECDSIIRAAYKSISNVPLFSFSPGILKPESDFDATTVQEDYIKQKLGIDIFELLEIKQKLMDEISGLIEGIENERR